MFRDYGIEIPASIPNDCTDTTRAIKLPVNIVEFTADSTADYVDLNGTATNYGDRAFVGIWRAQIENNEATNVERIGDLVPTGDDNVVFPFSARDTSPLSGTSYYIAAEVKTNGDINPFCERIQTVGDGSNDGLAMALCEQQKILPFLKIF